MISIEPEDDGFATCSLTMNQHYPTSPIAAFDSVYTNNEKHNTGWIAAHRKLSEQGRFVAIALSKKTFVDGLRLVIA